MSRPASSAPVVFVEQHFMKARDREQLSVRGKIEGSHDRRPGINRRMFGVVMRLGVRRRVVHGALLNPGGKQRHLVLLERGFAFGHAHLAIQGRDHFQDRTLVRMAGDDGRALGVTAGQQPFEIPHRIAALGFGRLMAALAVGLEYGTDVTVIARLGGGGGHRRFPAGAGAGRTQQGPAD